MKHLFATLALCIAMGFFSACSNSENPKGVNGTEFQTSYKVAILLPQDSISDIHWKQSAKWFSENLRKAFATSNHDLPFQMKFEWYDENQIDIAQISKELSKRDDILAVIGPASSANFATAAQNFLKTGKILISPKANAADVMRRYAFFPGIFALVETDISVCDKLLDIAKANGAKSVSLLAQSSTYSQTFIDKFVFLSIENGLNTEGVYVYNSENDLDSAMDSAFSDNADYIVCAPANINDVSTIFIKHKESKSKAKLLFSDIAHSPYILETGNLDGLEGISTTADPASGFESAYQSEFGTPPIAGESQFYDAMTLIALAKVWQDAYQDTSLYNSILLTTRADENYSSNYAWDAPSLSKAIDNIVQKKNPNIIGASGPLNLNPRNNMVVNKTFYCHWVIDNNVYTPIETISSGNKDDAIPEIITLDTTNTHVADTTQATNSSAITDTSWKDNYALIVSGSSGWSNYRHQADALSLYTLLKQYGFDDDHIVLIEEDDLAYNEKNPNPGQIIDFAATGISNKVTIDYKTSDLEPSDIESILLGQKTKKLQSVIESNINTNLLVFWTGHGEPGSFLWLDKPSKKSFTRDMMGNVLTKLSQENKYRKLLWITETCYGASVCDIAEELGIPEMACISATGKMETSQSKNYNPDLGVDMTNSFFMSLWNTLSTIVDENISRTSLIDFATTIAQYTYGSHVTVLNKDYFDLENTQNMFDFFQTKDFSSRTFK